MTDANDLHRLDKNTFKYLSLLYKIDTMPRLPGRRYIGPGNEVNLNYEGDPNSRAEYIAWRHDLAYKYGKTEEEIRHADLDAIQDFAINPETYEDVLGALGLSAKYLYESAAGVQYPSMPKALKSKTYRNRLAKERQAKRKKHFLHDQDFADVELQDIPEEPEQPEADLIPELNFEAQIEQPGPSHQRQYQLPETPAESRMASPLNLGGALDPPGSSMDTSGEALAPPVTGNAAAGGGHPAQPAAERTVLRCPVNKPWTRTFSNEFDFRTFGYPQKRNLALEYGAPVCKAVDATSYWYVPYNSVALYMSPAEFYSLPPGTEAVSCHVEIIPWYQRVPFETNVSVSGNANSHMESILMKAKGLDQHYDMVHHLGYNTSATDPTPTLARVGDDLRRKLWGRESDTDFPIVEGNARHIANYSAFRFTATNPNYKRLNTMIEKGRFLATQDQVWMKIDHKFQCGIIRKKMDPPELDTYFDQYNYPGVNFSIVNSHGRHRNFVSRGRVNKTNANYKDRHHEYAMADQLFNDYDSYFEYNQRIEKSTWLKKYQDDRLGHDPPSMHIGVLPVQTNTIPGSPVTFTSILLTWKIRATLTVRCDNNSDYSNRLCYDLDSYYITGIGNRFGGSGWRNPSYADPQMVSGGRFLACVSDTPNFGDQTIDNYVSKHQPVNAPSFTDTTEPKKKKSKTTIVTANV
uniref:VP1 n=1 Tax=Lupine feces-associated densovirus TaxID=2017717 RepID=A0A221LEC7_9VIRU|nr:VP1 [Lupine feces-associated densovirus]